MGKLFIFLLFMVTIQSSIGRKHQLKIINDYRKYFPISTFGFFTGGYLQVDVNKFKISQFEQDKVFGFSLEKMTNKFSEPNQERCQLTDPKKDDAMIHYIYFIFDLKNKMVRLSCSKELENILIVQTLKEIYLHKDDSIRKKRAVLPSSNNESTTQSMLPQIPVISPGPKSSTSKINGPGLHCSNGIPISFKDGSYNFSFVVLVVNQSEEGLYRLNFHNCYNYGNYSSAIDMDLNVIEMNPDENYLSAGEMPLPALYFMMSLLFFLSACFWFYILKKSKDPVFKIHYLMGLLVVIKALSLLFHGNNYHFIQTKGEHMEAWAIMYYIMHLIKGALLFTVLALIGSGWAFIKHVFSSKEKKIFMIVIPLQIIANVAKIIIEETEESNAEQRAWFQLLYLIDFLCCVAILLPVVWSIRHLQEASQTDDKAAISLRKLKLFRHFYIMIVCYIYFTRIIVSLLSITVPYQYEWFTEMFTEMATYVFFVMTGYKFRPADNNPYFLVEYDHDDDEVEVLTKSGLTEGVTRINQKNRSSSTQNLIQVEVYEDEDEVNLFPSNVKESSHDFD